MVYMHIRLCHSTCLAGRQPIESNKQRFIHFRTRFLAAYTVRAVSSKNTEVWKLDAKRMPFLHKQPPHQDAVSVTHVYLHCRMPMRKVQMDNTPVSRKGFMIDRIPAHGDTPYSAICVQRKQVKYKSTPLMLSLMYMAGPLT